MSDAPLNSERDLSIRRLAGDFSVAAADDPVDVAVGAAALFIVAQADVLASEEFDAYVARTLQKVVDLMKAAKR